MKIKYVFFVLLLISSILFISCPNPLGLSPTVVVKFNGDEISNGQGYNIGPYGPGETVNAFELHNEGNLELIYKIEIRDVSEISSVKNDEGKIQAGESETIQILIGTPTGNNNRLTIYSNDQEEDSYTIYIDWL